MIICMTEDCGQVALEVASTSLQAQQDMLTRSRKQHDARVEELRLDVLQVSRWDGGGGLLVP